MESDVLNEVNRIENCDLELLSKKEPLIVNNIAKRFKKKGAVNFTAVNHLSFGVQSRECFGLLGRNSILFLRKPELQMETVSEFRVHY